MADAIISDLTTAATLALTDLIELEQGTPPTNSSKKATLTQLKALLLGKPVSALTNSAGTVDVDLDAGAKENFTLLLAANVTTFNVTDLPGVGYVAEFEVEIKQNGTGGYTVTLPASFKATGGSDTAVALAANAVTVLSAKSFDNGTTWRYAMQETA